jgi:hypothetical protein
MALVTPPANPPERDTVTFHGCSTSLGWAYAMPAPQNTATTTAFHPHARRTRIASSPSRSRRNLAPRPPIAAPCPMFTAIASTTVSY